MANEVRIQSPHPPCARANVGHDFPEVEPIFNSACRPIFRGVLVGFFAAACFSTPYFAPAILAGRAEDLSLAINHTIVAIPLAPFLGGVLFGLAHMLFRR
jgi:hypothetical protein